MKVRAFLLAAACAAAATPSASADPVAPCVPVPVLDDRCEAWSAHGVHDAAEVGGPIAASDGKVFDAAIVYGTDGFGDWSVTARTSQGDSLWTTRFDGGDQVHDFPYSIAISPDGDKVFVAGIVNNDWMLASMGIVAFDAETGAELWRTTHVGLLEGMTYARSVAVTPDGSSVVVTGSVHDGGFSDAAYETLALDTEDGSVLWQRSYHPGPASPYSVAIAPTGDVAYVTGIAGAGFGGEYVMGTIAYDMDDGSELWISNFEGGWPIDGGQSVAVSPDGSGVFVSGWSQVGPFTTLRVRSAFTVVAIDAATGEERWSSRTEGTSPGLSVAHHVEVSPDSRTVVAAGHMQGDVPELDFDLWTAAFDASSGEVRWIDRERIPGMLSELVGLGPVAGISPDGARVYVIAQVRPIGPSSFGEDPSQAVTLAYDLTSGERAWTARFNATVPGDSTSGARIAVDDGVYVTGTTYSIATGSHSFVARYEL